MTERGRVTPNDSKPRFGTILGCRTNKQRPSKMEIHLRGCCQRMKIVENLDGAHFLLQEVKLAIRVYYPEDVKRFDELLRQSQASKVEEIHQLIENVHSGNVGNNQDLDGLDAFRNHFKSTVVICVLPQAGSNDQFANSGSFVNRVQQIMCTWDRSGKNSRVVFVPATGNAAEDALLTQITNMKNSGAKKKYFERQRQSMFIPNEAGVIAKNSDAAVRVREVLQDWASQNNLPEGEESVLMAYLKNLGSIATASPEQLQAVPVEMATKAALFEFFGSKARSQSTNNVPSDLARSAVRPHSTAAISLRGTSASHPITALRSSFPSQLPTTQAKPTPNQTFGKRQNQPSYLTGGGVGARHGMTTGPPTGMNMGNDSFASCRLSEMDHIMGGYGDDYMATDPNECQSFNSSIMAAQQPRHVISRGPALLQHQQEYSPSANQGQYYGGGVGGVGMNQGFFVAPPQPQFSAFQQQMDQSSHCPHQQMLAQRLPQQMDPQARSQQHQLLLQPQYQQQQHMAQQQPPHRPPRGPAQQQQHMTQQGHYHQHQGPALRRNSLQRKFGGIRRLNEF